MSVFFLSLLLSLFSCLAFDPLTFCRLFLEDRHGGTRISYCKNPVGCEGVTLLGDDAVLLTTASCKLCGYSYCANCDHMKHAPATCEMLKQW